MTTPTSNRFDSVLSAGASTGGSGLVPVVTIRAPASSDIRGPNGPFKVGQNWVDSTNNAAYELTSFTSSNGSVTATWVTLGGGAGAVATLTGDSGTATPSGGNIQIAGTANQIATAGSGAVVTLSLTGPYTPATYTAHGVLLGEGTGSIVSTTAGATGQTLMGSTGADPAFTGSPSFSGSVTAGTTVTATLGAITATNGNLVLGTAGNKILSTSVGTTTTAGANSFGTVTLVGGTATVATTSITTNSIVFLTRQTIGATGAAALGMISRGTIVNGVSFIINALSTTDATALAATDVSNIGWMIVN